MTENSSPLSIEALMNQSRVAFGTSGVRGREEDMTDRVCYAYTMGFVQYLANSGELGNHERIAIAGDLRRSTDRILRAVCTSIRDMGYRVENCGKLPSPALAYHGFTNGIPTVMVTGSHIPEDRNGIKFATAHGEVLKCDEVGIKNERVRVPEDVFDLNGNLLAPMDLPPESPDACLSYVDRYVSFFGAGCLEGKKIGIYQHSAVGRDILQTIYSALGARLTLLGCSEKFIPVDTEAIRPEDVELARLWAKEFRLDSIVSTDGDSDRPLISDEDGKWLRGDVAGILCAKHLGADAVATPVTSNSAVEKCRSFASVIRTKIGSPYVIEAMTKATEAGFQRVVGYEANGGFLIDSDIECQGRMLRRLPTRDAVIVQIALLSQTTGSGMTVADLVDTMPRRFTQSDRVPNFPSQISSSKIAELYDGISHEPLENLRRHLSSRFGEIMRYDTTDGLRITLANEEVVHLRPSGNAPELRCYSEADTDDRAKELVAICMRLASDWRTSNPGD